MTVSLETSPFITGSSEAGRVRSGKTTTTIQLVVRPHAERGHTEAEASRKEVQTAPHRFGPPLTRHSDQAGFRAKPGRYNHLPNALTRALRFTVPPRTTGHKRVQNTTCTQCHVYTQPLRVHTSQPSRPTTDQLGAYTSVQAPRLNESTASPRAVDRRPRHAALPTPCRR